MSAPMYTPTDQDFIAALTAPKKTNDPLKLEAVRGGSKRSRRHLGQQGERHSTV